MAGRSASRSLSWIASGLIALLLAACDNSEPQQTGGAHTVHRLAAGEPFPDLLLPGLDRPDLPITALRGKVVVLNVWATWCPPCRRELPSLQRLTEKLDPERFAVIGMSVDDDDHLPREYLIDREIELVSYIDHDMSIASEALGVQVYPDTFIIAVDGTLLARIDGEREWDSDEVISALEAAWRGDRAALQSIVLQDVRE